MTNILNKLVKAIFHPTLAYRFLVHQYNNRCLKTISISGKIFYQFKGDLYPEYLYQGNASSHIVEFAKKYCNGYGLDIGANKWGLSGAIPIENEENQNAYKLDNFKDGSLDYVFSSHCLEHLNDWKRALKLWVAKLNTGGTLFLYLPHQSMKLWHRHSPWVLLDHIWRPRYEIINPFLIKIGMQIIDYNPGKDEYWSFYIVARKI